MPFISFKTNHKLTLKQENNIVARIGELISIIPGKSEEQLMIHMEDNQIMYFKGEDRTCMMIEIKLYNEAPNAAKAELTKEISQMICDTTNILIEDIYVIYDEYQNWGSKGILK